jgi:FkbM family methyltransferase
MLIYLFIILIIIYLFNKCFSKNKELFGEKKNWLNNIPKYEKKITSQGKQDGVIEYIIKNINIKNKYCIEFGYNSTVIDGGSGPNTLQLIKKNNWENLFLDGNNENPNINLYKHMLTTDNICKLFKKYKVPKEPGFISIYVDSIDIWLCDKILEKYHPSFFCIEFNPNFPIEYAIAFPNDGNVWENDRCMGSSLKAIKLMVDKHKKYELVYAGDYSSSKHHDAFFIRKDLIKNIKIPKFNSFKSIHNYIHKPTQNNREEILIDYEYFLKTGNINESRKKALPISKKYIANKKSKEETIVIKNPIDSNISMLWLDNTFTRNNHPGPDFQKKQKKEALKYILERGKGVIDCGAHIGDFGICLAIVLKVLKRNDIMVYCIDPSEEKCNFMKYICKLNKLDETNIKIINCGLSDRIGNYSIGSKNRDGDGNKPSNTGGWQWIKDDNGIEFKTLDYLYEKKIINKIGFFWMDAQWMEYEIIKGGIKYLSDCKPYILMEYDPASELYPNGIAKKYKKGSKKELKSDNKFKRLFSEIGIKISNKGDELDDILLEFEY